MNTKTLREGIVRKGGLNLLNNTKKPNITPPPLPSYNKKRINFLNNINGENKMDKYYYDFIKNWNEFENFFNILPPLKEDNVWLLVLQARKKYLTDNQKKIIHLKSTDAVVDRKIIRCHDFARFKRTILRFCTQIGSYVDQIGNPIPENAFVIYFTINPRSTLKAYNEFSKLYNDYWLELINSQNKKEVYNKINLIDRKIINKIQSCRGSKYFVDIDVDVVDKEKGVCFLNELLNFLNYRKSKFYVIETRGGYHVLVKKETITPLLNKELYTIIMVDLNNRGHSKLGNKFEIIINKQDMSPIPGTLQGGFVVKLYANNI